MLRETVIKLERLSRKYHGYISTEELLREGITNRQIGVFVEIEMLERVCHGHYWFPCFPFPKPSDYKAIEVCFSAPEAVICADSACFYLGLIDQEPEKLSVATRRSDRRRVGMNFPISRHYYAERTFGEYQNTVETEFGRYSIYDRERSVCDCIRFRKEIEEDIFAYVLENYKKQEQTGEKLLQYAKTLRLFHLVKKYV
ncbi:MAG: hypothetical protein HFH12_06275 [Dorea sp.]|nr:hypothetical protein [Dorea sp.]